MQKRRASRARLIFGRHDLKQRRPCICCADDFISYGPHNRLCARCKVQDSDYSSLGLDLSRR